MDATEWIWITTVGLCLGQAVALAYLIRDRSAFRRRVVQDAANTVASELERRRLLNPPPVCENEVLPFRSTGTDGPRLRIYNPDE